MSIVTGSSPSHRALVPEGEWRTIALVGATWAGWIVLTLYWSSIPIPILVAAAGYCLALYGSLQHEVIHGHPTRNEHINRAMVWMPLTMWLPLSVYESSHRAHHLSELTHPHADPESWYVPEDEWRNWSAPRRALWQFNNTLAGRMVLGPWISAYRTWAQQWRRLVEDGSNAGMVLCHAAGVGIVLTWTTVIAQMPVHVYLLAFVWPGISLSLVRSFLEHRYDADPARRTAVVRGGPFTRLVFLNNNYHVVHHARPELPWYRIPALYRREAAAIEDANGGFCFDGYGSITRRYLFRPWTLTVYPASTER